jgi:predicted RNase H-like nuclease
MRLICGADGCKGGWIVINKDLDSGLLSWRSCKTAHELVYFEHKPQMIAIDIPIGLPGRGPRACDLEARQLLGPGRASSVFPAPIRPILAATNYPEACEIRFQIEQKRISKQTWAIMPKIRDVDAVLRQDSELRTRVREVHPEVCFYFLAGRRLLQHNKKHKLGREERHTLLEPIFGHWLQAALAERHQLASAEDDVLDAFVALWTAERIIMDISQTIPSEPAIDSFGLRMEMVA